MSSLAKLLGAAVRGLEGRFDEVRNRDGRRPRQIVAYRGFGTADALHVTGRVLANEPLWAAGAEDPWWRNLRATWRRMGSAEVPGALVEVVVAGGSTQAVTDDEGYFRARVQPQMELRSDRLWHEGEVRLVTDKSIRGPVLVLTPPPGAEFGVVSDLDDTVLRTDVANRLRMFRELLLGNSRTRLPFHGVAAFYRALHGGARRRGLNPLFYVSSNPWNLYDLLLDFLDHQGIPIGPLFLRDWGVSEHELLPRRHSEHKRGAIRHILETYPDLAFILIGDSGQQDPEIYCDVVREYPGRIRAVYIRNVTPTAARLESIRRLAAEVMEAGCRLVLSDDTLSAASHAAAHGWIDPLELERIAAEERANGDRARARPPR